MVDNRINLEGPIWRESSTLIICVKCPKTNDGYDYELLMIKRSDRTAVIKNQAVFPGGIYDSFDESVEWLKYFEEFGVAQQSLKDLVLIDNKTERPKIFAPQGTGCYDRFFKKSKIWAREISLRITAIRETFEETGILLCSNKNQINNSGDNGICDMQHITTKWQKAVHNDPKIFLQMCRELQVIPDLWRLHEWSCWASPAVIKKGYETAFYITFLDEKPEVFCEETEVKEHFWLPPSTLLKMVKDTQLFFLPPQYYEISRFIPCKSYDYLKSFAKQHREEGAAMYHPIVYLCTDGFVYVLPGDDYYTGCPRLSTVNRDVDFSVDEFRAHAKRIHRIEEIGTSNAVIHLNFDPMNGHLKPLCSNGMTHKL